MKTKYLFIIITFLLISSAASAQDKSTKMTGDQEKEQQRWMQYMSPGEMHKMLASAEGDWHEVVVFWMDPKGEPTKTESECSNSMIMGGRYQESIHKGDMMGMPFEGKGLMGFDNIKKVFQSTWVDNMGTGIMYMEGPYNADKKTINFSGTMVDPMSGKETKMREVMTFVNDKTQKIEMYAMKDGKEYKSMEINLTKR
jgi:hypothetical protein